MEELCFDKERPQTLTFGVEKMGERKGRTKKMFLKITIFLVVNFKFILWLKF